MKTKQKAEPESHRKSSYKGNSRNNSKSGGLTFSEKKRLIQLKHILSGKSNEKGGRVDLPPDLQHGRVQKTDETIMDFFHGGECYP